MTGREFVYVYVIVYYNEAVVKLFISNTDDDDFRGFSAQEEDEDCNEWVFWQVVVLLFSSMLQALFGKR